MKSNVIKDIILLPFIFIFLPSFVMFIGEKTFFAILALVMPLGYIILIANEKLQLFSRIKYLYEKTCLKNFSFIYFWILISGLLAVAFGYYTFSRFLYVAVLAFIFRGLLVFLYSALVVPKYISLKKVTKLFTIAYFLIFVWGFIEFVGVYFNIEIINSLVSLLSNVRSAEESIILDDYSGIPRIRSVFFEPSAYAKFLIVSLPFVLDIARCKYKILENNLMNIILKKSLIPFALLSLILTQSPIYLIFCPIVTAIYYYKEILKLIKKYYLIIICICVSLLFILNIFISTVDLSKTYLSRIFNVLEVLPKMSLDMFILVEPSLGTRVVNNINQFKIFLEHPLIGVGFGNTGNFLIKFFMHSTTPLTEEMQIKLLNAKSTLPMTTNAMYLLLYQTGIIGFLLYCYWMVKSIIMLKRAKIYFSGLEYSFVIGLQHLITTMFAISIIYEQWFMDEYLFFIGGIACAIIYIAKIKKYKIKIIKSENNEASLNGET